MKTRQFSSDNLYKLTKGVVITISSLALILGAFSLKEVYSDKNVHEWLKSCKEGIEYNRLSCQTGIEHLTIMKDLAGKEISLGIILPMFFFGGIQLYKYLFPVKKK